MINQSFYRVIPTSLDINGPILSFTQTPTGISGQIGDNVSFIGVATATFIGAGNTATPTGSIAYRWYEGSVALSNGNRLSGTATTTLALSNIQFSDSSRVFYLEARFNPSAYGNGKNGRAINEPIYSNVIGASVQLPPPPGASISASSTSIAYDGSVTINWNTSGATSLSSNFERSELNGSITISNLISSRTFTITASNQGGSTTRSVTVNVAGKPPPPPVIRITSQPSNSSATFDKCTGSGVSVTFSVIAEVDNPTGATLSYQWYLNGNALSDSTNVSGVTGTTLTLRVLENQGGNNTLFVRVSYSGASTVQSNTVNYIVNVIEFKPVITQTAGLPLDKTVFDGETATFDITASASDGRGLNYQWTNNGVLFVDGTNNSPSIGNVSGSRTSRLSIVTSSVGTFPNLYATITDPSSTCTASNSPFQSESAILTVITRPKIIKVASRGDESTSIGYQDVNLSTFDYGSGNIEFYSPFEDIVVDIKMEGGKGRDFGNFRGGEGGVAIVRLTLRQNTEYMIRPLPSNNGNGGGGCFLYEQARLIAVCGGGGGAGTNGNGGRGGGAGIPGENGSGSGYGSGGTNSARSLGYFPGGDVYCDASKTSIFGGIISSCTIGDRACTPAGFWRTNYSPCGNYGNSALNTNGTAISGAALIGRGFKGGVGHRNNGGYAQNSNDGAGGSGCGGGNAASNGSGGGGGGAGGFGGAVSTKLGGRTSGTTGQYSIGLVGRFSL